jgi:DNA-binding transcriptional regulator YhcF (GntR family)
MEFLLSRRGPATLQEQLGSQIEMKIMAGELAALDRLPSVRALGRLLKIHPNTVSAVYKRLTRDGWVARERGARLYVRRGAPCHAVGGEGTDQPSLDEALHAALDLAFRRGFTAQQIRSGLERWLATAPPSRVVVVDTNAETATLMVHEIRQRVGGRVSSCLLNAVGEPGTLADAVVVTWPHHLEPLRRFVPTDVLAPLALRLSTGDVAAMMRLPAEAVAVVVSCSPRVLRYAAGLIYSARGGDVVVRCVLLSEAREWRSAAPAAHTIFADALAAPVVARVAPHKVHEFRLVKDEACVAIRRRLSFARIATGAVPQADAAIARPRSSTRRIRSSGRTGAAEPSAARAAASSLAAARLTAARP